MRDVPSQPPVDPSELKLAVDGLTAFAANLHAQLRARSGNLLVSPYSIGTALAMLAAGARGTTFDELQRVLHLPPVEKLASAFRGLAAGIATVPKWVETRPELTVANALWAQEDHPWNASYLALVRDAFQGALFGTDFRRDAGSVVGRVNDWVNKQTRGRISNLVAPGAFDFNTRIVATNAVYFKARWSSVFEPRDTKPGDFTLSTGARVKAPLMYQQKRFGYFETKTFQALCLPYIGGTASMYAFLPRTRDGLPELEQKLTSANLIHWTTFCEACDVKVWLPKFRFSVPTQLRSVLAALGLNVAFDPLRADFKGITDHPEGLFLSDVVHQARIEVDESGTVAAAATYGAAGGGFAGPREPPPPPKVFRADHPFLFVIKHEETGAVLFIGRVEDPTK